MQGSFVSQPDSQTANVGNSLTDDLASKQVCRLTFAARDEGACEEVELLWNNPYGTRMPFLKPIWKLVSIIEAVPIGATLHLVGLHCIAVV